MQSLAGFFGTKHHGKKAARVRAADRGDYWARRQRLRVRAKRRPRYLSLRRAVVLLLFLPLFIAVGLLTDLVRGTEAPLSRGLGRVAAAAGFGIDRLSIIGYEKASVREILEALDLAETESIFGFDTDAARRRIESLAWVKRARLSRILPNGLGVEIAERKPYAVWQRGRLLFLVDKAGRTLEPAGPADYPDLPLVVGKGAARHAGEVLDLAAVDPYISSHFKAGVRVGNRRWDLHLTNGLIIQLPVTGAREALSRLAVLNERTKIFKRAISHIDLRVDGRVVVALANPLAERIRRRGRLRLAGKLGETGRDPIAGLLR